MVDAILNKLGKVIHIRLRHVGLHHIAAQHLVGHGVKQQPGGGVGVIRILLDQGARCQHRGFVDFVHGHAVIQVAQRLRHDGLGFDLGTQSGAGRLDQALQARQIQHNPLPLVQRVQHRSRWRCLADLSGTFLGAFFAVQHISARHFVMAAAHQAQFNLVLHIFNVKSAAARTRAHQRANHGLRQDLDGFTNTG